MTRHMTVFVLFVGLAAISIVHGGRKSQPCQGKVARGNWAGVCFGTQARLEKKSKCDVLVKNSNGCPTEMPTCCVDCDKQTPYCHRKYGGSVSRNVCCPNERIMGPQIREGSGCYCCKHCKPKTWCRRHKGKCITKGDPVYNEAWCLAQPGGKVKKRACRGNGCWCCVWDR